jgi:hypothetical protein
VKTILMHPAPRDMAFRYAKKGEVFTVLLDGLRWPLELRQKPPRVAPLEDVRGRLGPVLCELLDPWPGAPDYYPPEWAPGAAVGQGSLYYCCPIPGRQSS